MRISRVSTKEKRRYALDNLGGVDFSASPLLCAPNRSPDAVNWIGDHGINRKRNGWEQVMDRFIAAFPDTDKGIQGIIPVDDTVLVAAHGVYYKCYMSQGRWKSERIQNMVRQLPVSAWRSGDLVYIIGADEYHAYDQSKSKFVYFGKDIDPYIPTTTYGIGYYGQDVDTQMVQGANLLTVKRKNVLHGFSQFPNKYQMGDEVINCAIYFLDAKILPKSVVNISVDYAKMVGGEYVSTETAEIASTEEDPLTLYREGLPVGTVRYDDGGRGRIIIYGGTYPEPVEETPNITVTFTADVEDRSTYISHCRFGTLYGYGGAHDRLFLSGNPKFPNVVFFSQENDFTYFPDTYTITLGGESDPAKGFTYLADNTLAVLCDKSVYYIGGEGRTEYDEKGKFKRITPVFSRQAGAISEGALNAFCTANFGGDNVFLSNHGLFGIEPTSNVLTNTRTARERSYAINARLNLLDPAKASIFTHGQRLYISDGENCFVADSAYKYVPTGSEGYNYEWWYWTHVPARVWAEVNGELWFGTADGRVCRFTDGYTDVTWDYTLDGEITYKDTVSVTYNEEDKVGEIVNDRRVRFVNTETGTWSDAIGDLTEVDLYARLTQNGLQFARYNDATEEELIKFTGNGQNPILRVYDDRPVVAEWVSPPLDLGNDSIAKTLFSLSVTAEAGQKSKLTFGYETRKGGGEWTAQGLGKFSFEDFDFCDFSFETGFQNTHTVRARDRNFNFIRFYFRSDGDRPCAVHRIAAIYKNNMYNKGVV